MASSSLDRQILVRVVQVKWLERAILFECKELKKIFPRPKKKLVYVM